MIEALEGGLPAEAEGSRVDRVVWIPLELHDASLAVPREDAAAGRAFAANGREPCGHARYDLLVRYDEREDGLGGLLAAGRRGGCAGRGHDLEKVAALHLSSARGRIRPRVASDRHAWLRFTDPTEGGE